MEMKALVKKLNEASRAYYQEDKEIMSNLEYDALYDELIRMEKESGITLSNSPTIKVGYEVLSELPKVRHESPMLSLDKTKEPSVLKDWLGSQKGILSWKLDGLTVVLTYEDGRLSRAVTRGNGEVGELITNNAMVFKNIPHAITYKGTLVLRGEAVIKYSDFNKLNETIEDVDARYKNPRNLASGSVRQLNNEITAGRNVHFFAFGLVDADGVDFKNSREQQFQFLTSMGFDCVERMIVESANIEEAVTDFSNRIVKNDFPSDGLVLTYDDIAYSQSLGRTAKFPKDSMAFKWADEMKETTLKEVEWSASRTGLINPVAIFEPVELEGTTVARASVHNISIVKTLKLGIGDTITVFKANMIIPQIAANLTESDTLKIPDTCPVCGGEAKIRQINDVQALYCTNPECQAKKIKSYALFVSRDAFNIEGLSEASLEKFVQMGLIKEFADIFKLKNHSEVITEAEGFGEKSFENLVTSIEKARTISVPKFIYSLGILNIGLSNARLICGEYKDDFEKMRHADEETLAEIKGIGGVIAKTFVEYFADEKNNQIVDRLLEEVILEKTIIDEAQQTLIGKTFVITGSLEHFENRNALKAAIEEKGGKVAGSVSKKTTYLVNNDAESNSSKNKKAKELGVTILTETEVMELL